MQTRYFLMKRKNIGEETMNKRTKIITYITIFIIVLAEVIIFVNTRKALEQNNGVIEVNEDNFEKEVLQSRRKVLIDFYATWCNPCKELEPIIEEVANEHNNIKIVKVDVDKCKELVSKYNIKAMPTLIVIEKGNEINRSLGADSRNKILEICGIK